MITVFAIYNFNSLLVSGYQNEPVIEKMFYINDIKQFFLNPFYNHSFCPCLFVLILNILIHFV